MYLDSNTLHGMQEHVTADDIEKGTGGSCQACPIALAVQRMFPTYEICVEMEQITLFEADEVYAVLRASEALADWIDAYDNENNVTPITLFIKTLNVKEYKYMIDMTTEQIAA